MTLQGLPVTWRLILLIGFHLHDTASMAADQGDEYWDSTFGSPGVNGSSGVVLYGSKLVNFGAFNSVGGIAATNIAEWNGVEWSQLGGGVKGSHVGAAASGRGHLYVGGLFSSAGGIVASNLARWDGVQWSEVGGGANGIVFALASNGTNVYAGGHFTEAGGIAASKVAKWDGQNWSALGAGIIPVFEGSEWVGTVDSLAVNGADVFAGGRFRNAGGTAATNIARWDGTNWHSLGKGLRYFDGTGSENGAVRALAVINGVLFAGGEFRLAGDVEATNIARWDGSSWQPVGSGVNDFLSVLALSSNGTELYAGGSFRLIGGIEANRIAKWDGNSWHPLGQGIGGQLGDGVLSLVSTGGELFVGGYFPSAGGKPSRNIALWHIAHALSVSQTGDQVNLSWPATGTNFVLEAKDDVAGANWSEVSQPPVLHNNECVVTQAVSTASQFYRLRRR